MYLKRKCQNLFSSFLFVWKRSKLSKKSMENGNTMKKSRKVRNGEWKWIGNQNQIRSTSFYGHDIFLKMKNRQFHINFLSFFRHSILDCNKFWHQTILSIFSNFLFTYLKSHFVNGKSWIKYQKYQRKTARIFWQEKKTKDKDEYIETLYINLNESELNEEF